jgi:hypothetical protein
MTAARRPSVVPLPPLRAKTLPGFRIEARGEARAHQAKTLDLVCKERRVSNARLAEHIGGEMRGARIRSGGSPLELGEAMLELPLGVAVDLVAELLLDRLVEEEPVDAEDGMRRRLLATHLRALKTLA